MFEYGLLAILICEALMERLLNGLNVKFPIFTAIMISGTVGLLDEFIQKFISYRVFDIVDIGFNYMASAFGVLLSLGVQKIQVILSNRNTN